MGIGLPAAGFPSSLIELKSGAEFVTAYHWEEGEFVKFYLYGGVVGFKKNQVKQIRPTAMSPIPQSHAPDEKLSATSSASVEIAPSEEEKALSQDEEAPAMRVKPKEFAQKQAELEGQIAAVLEGLKKAQAENDVEKMKAERKKLLNFKTDLHHLQTGLMQEVSPKALSATKK